MSKSEITLCMIASTEAEAKPFLDRYRAYFDDVVVICAPDCQDFAAARQKGLEKVKTPYWMWADTDDEIEDPENIRQIVADMQANELDAAYLEYVYGYNEQREPIAVHWRERIIRTAHPFKWVGAVHETLISDQNPTGLKYDRVIVKHAYKDEDQLMQSALRNHRIMEKLVQDGDEDPRTLYYLGRSYFMLKRYLEAAQTLNIYVDQSGWDEQKYDAWMKIGDCLIMMDEIDKSINANLEAIKLNPKWPDAYYKMGDLYLHLEQPGRAIEWIKDGMRRPAPETLEITDPTLYTYRPLVSLALAHFGLARVNEADRYIKEAAKFQPKSPIFKNAYRAITSAKIEEDTIKSAAWLGKFVKEQGNLKQYIDGLPPFIKNDLRLRPLRVEAHPPVKWPKKSIVFYCGEQWEDWGPDTLENGMGGSEEAVVYLSRELAKQGWAVVVYNQRATALYETWMGDKFIQTKVDREGLPHSSRVTYKPWETFNPEDEFDVFVAWRNPRLISSLKIKARLACVDFHDCPVGHQTIPQKALESIDLCFFKSQFQREMAPNVPDEKVVIVPNGIVPEQFDVEVERNPQKVIYASSADRGLDTLVRDIWPAVKREVPEAELVWAYGWNSYDAMHKGDAKQGKWKWELKRDMFKAGVKELGRLSHEDLAREFKSSGVWAYPTYFDEIDCITAKKAQAAGCDAITTGRAALQTSVLKDEADTQDMALFTQRLIDALKTPPTEKQRNETAKKVLTKFAWSAIAEDWSKALNENNPDSSKR